MGSKQELTILHICDYAALYRGNFIDSLESIEKYHSNIKNIYLFPARAKNTQTKKWINEMNRDQVVAYIQEGNLIKNISLVNHILKKHKVDKIVRHFSDLRIDILLKFFFNSKKVIRFFHCRYLETNPVKHTVRKILWNHNKLVGVSNFVANDLQGYFPMFSITSIPNAISFTRLDTLEPFTKADGICVLMMGWSYEIKGVDLAIKVINELRSKYPVVLQIVGGKNEDKIKVLAKNILKYEADWIHFLPPTNNIGTYYSNSDIFLSPSRQEAFGYANIEAVYCKNSIVLSKVDGQGELQIEGAYWFESENIEEFTKQLETAILELNNPERIAQQESDKEQVQQIYSLENWTNKLVDLLYQ